MASYKVRFRRDWIEWGEATVAAVDEDAARRTSIVQLNARKGKLDEKANIYWKNP